MRIPQRKAATLQMESLGQGYNGGFTSHQNSKRKRLKVAMACKPCRARKVKCDGVRPVCGTCEKNFAPADCVYSRTGDGRSPARDRQLPPLRTSRRQASFRSGQNSTPPHGLSQSETQTSRASPNGSRTASSQAAGNEAATTGGQQTSSKTEQDELNGADSMTGVTGDPTQTHEIFGSSSAGSFMRQVQAAVDVRSLPPQLPSTATERPRTQSFRRILEDPELFLLPPRALADGLIRAYWDDDWSLYPIVARCDLEAVYESLWAPGNLHSCQPEKLSLLNVCFALGCHYTRLLRPEERVATGNQFFSRAERLHRTTEDAPSLENVQYLLLSGIYLQSTNKVFQCWMTVGRAIRMAQSLGLHLAQPTPYSETTAQREYRRRTWFGCVWLDRVLSATFGRPGLVPGWLSESVPLPSMVDDEFFNTQVEGSSARPVGSPCKVAFFVKAVELYKILGDVLTCLYLIPISNDEFRDKLGKVLEMDGQLQRWRRSLPGHLSDRAPGGDAILERQVVTLRIRYLHVRTLLFRPALVHHYKFRTLGPSDRDHASCDKSLSECLISECSQLCFQAAHEVIETFDRNLNAHDLTGPLPCWWYSVLYVYTAATIVFLERFMETKRVVPKRSAACHAWDAALRVLRSYSVLGDSARRCVAALECLSKKFALDETGDEAATGPGQDNLVEGWDAYWGAPDSLGGQADLLNPGFFTMNFEDLSWLGLFPGPFGQDSMEQAI